MPRESSCKLLADEGSLRVTFRHKPLGFEKQTSELVGEMLDIGFDEKAHPRNFANHEAAV